MSFQEFFPLPELTSSEYQNIKETLSNETLIRYLKQLAYATIAEEININLPVDQSPEEYIRTRYFVKGQLNLIQHLLALPTSSSSETTFIA